jgi:hypothetical protein
LNPSFLDFTLYRLPDGSIAQDRITGEGRRHIWLLYEANPEEAEELSAFLGKILQAAKIDRLRDAKSIRITPGERISLQQIPAWEEASHLLLFGTKPIDLGLNLQLQAYHPTPFLGTTLLWSDALKTIQEERQKGGKQLSGQLWRALQQLFLT